MYYSSSKYMNCRTDLQSDGFNYFNITLRLAASFQLGASLCSSPLWFVFLCRWWWIACRATWFDGVFPDVVGYPGWVGRSPDEIMKPNKWFCTFNINDSKKMIPDNEKTCFGNFYDHLRVPRHSYDQNIENRNFHFFHDFSWFFSVPDIFQLIFIDFYYKISDFFVLLSTLRSCISALRWSLTKNLGTGSIYCSWNVHFRGLFGYPGSSWHPHPLMKMHKNEKIPISRPLATLLMWHPVDISDPHW